MSVSNSTRVTLSDLLLQEFHSSLHPTVRMRVCVNVRIQRLAGGECG
jgi:hypothetical protein